MEQRISLASLITKLMMLVILLLLLVGAFIWPVSRAAAQAASCDTIGKICPTGTGTHPITEEDVINYLINEPYMGHNVSLVRFMSIQKFIYEPLGQTNYFQDMSGTGIPSVDTPALSVTFCGLFRVWSERPRAIMYTVYSCDTIIFNVQTGAWLKIGPA
jgi:hypothetical protein